MNDQNILIKTIAGVAERWTKIDYEARVEAIDATLTEDNAFTEEAISFAINQQMELLTELALTDWAGGKITDDPVNVGVLGAGNIPFVNLQDFLAVILSGHHYFGHLSSKSSFLLPAFAADLKTDLEAAGGENDYSLEADFGSIDEVFNHAEALIATGTDETLSEVAGRCDKINLKPENRLLRGNRFSIAILDGHENLEELGGLAEDVLLHEGEGCRNVAIIWSPAGGSPDPVLDVFQQFREVFPAHKKTNGRLAMQRAFLKAVKLPHAWGEGFLMSNADPDVQGPAHIRWCEYQSIKEVEDWITENDHQLQLVLGRPAVKTALNLSDNFEVIGNAQRPTLAWCADGINTIDFLFDLQA